LRPRNRTVLIKVSQFVKNIREIDGVVSEFEIPSFGISSECFMKLIELLGGQIWQWKSRLKMTSTKITFISPVFWSFSFPPIVNLLSMFPSCPGIFEMLDDSLERLTIECVPELDGGVLREEVDLEASTDALGEGETQDEDATL